MLISVVIPTRDKAAHLALTLRCLLTQRVDAAFEVIVVDDGSTDHTADVARSAAESGLPLRVLRRVGEGRAAARNAGAAAADGALLVFLDDDILVPPGFLAAHLAARDAATPIGPAADHRVVHGPLRELPRARALIIDQPDDPHGTVVAGAYGRTVVNALERLVLAMADGSAPPIAPWLACVGANVSMPRELWRSAGGFDEGFGTVWGCEDLELGFRLAEAGAALCLAPDAAGVHLTHARPGRWEEHSVNLDRFRAKHPHPAVAALDTLLTGDGKPADYLDRFVRLQDLQTTPRIVANRHKPGGG